MALPVFGGGTAHRRALSHPCGQKDPRFPSRAAFWHLPAARAPSLYLQEGDDGLGPGAAVSASPDCGARPSGPSPPVVLSAERPGVGVLLRSSSRSSWLCQRASNSPGKKGQRATPSDGQEGGKKPRGEKRFCVRPGSVQQARGLPLGGSAPAASVRATKPRPFGEAPNGLAVRESDPCAQLPRGLHVAEPPGSLPGDWGHWCQ